MTTNFIGTLLTNSPTYTVTSGFSTLLYDAYGSQTVTVSSGGSLSLVGAMGANTIRLHGNADAWQVMRSGSTTIFIHTNGDRVEVPAIIDQQTISFADQSAALRTDTSGVSPVVKLGLQVIGTSASAIDAWSEVNPETPGASSEQAPWTLVMQYGSTSFVSDGSTVGTHSIQVPQNMYSGYITTPDFTKVIAYGTSQGIWSISDSATSSKLADTFFTTGYTLGARYAGELNGGIAFVQGYGESLWTDGVTAQVSQLDFGYDYSVIDADAGNIWTNVSSSPYGSELGLITVSSNGLESIFVKDINPGGSSALQSFTGAVLPDGKLVFNADDGSGFEPWVSDGTESGTFKLIDFSRYYYGSGPNEFVTFGEKVAFVASLFGGHGDYGRVLVLTDGTTEGTTWVDPIEGSSDFASILGVVNDQIFLTVSQNDVTKLFSSDGVTSTEIATISGGASLIAWTDQIAYFSASDNTHGNELWALNLDGSGSLTMVKDILVGTGSAISGYNQQSFLVGDKLAFTAYSSAVRESFYLSDGTAGGTVQLSAHAPAPDAYQIIDQALYFTDVTGTYFVDTALVTPTAVRLGATNSNMQSDGNQVFFLANDELYVSSPESVTAMKLADNVGKFKVFQDNALYFIQEGSGGVLSLWYSDGTTSGTRYIEDLPTNNLDDYNLESAVAIRTAGTPEPVDSTAPVLRSAHVVGDQLVLSYSDVRGLDDENVPLASAFSLSGTDAAVTAVVVDSEARTVTLSLSGTVLSNEQIRISYTSAGVASSDVLQDLAGNQAANLTNRSVVNRTADNVAPTVVSALVEGATLILQLADAHDLDAVNLPPASAFSLVGTDAVVESVLVDASAKTVTLTLSQAVLTGEQITLSYEDPSEANDTNALQDTLGNDLASFSGHSVQNNSQEQSVWTLLMSSRGGFGENKGFYASDATETGSGFVVTVPGYYYSSIKTNDQSTAAVLAFKEYSGSDWQVYGSDSISGQTVLLANDVSWSNQPYKIGNTFVFEGATGLITDGTAVGSVVIQNLDFGKSDEANQIVWSANYSAPYGYELYKTELNSGTVASVLVKDINPGADSGTPQGYLKGAIVLGNGNLIFVAHDGVHGFEPWVSDGTEDGTFMLRDLSSAYNSWPSQMTLFGDQVVFSARISNPDGVGDYSGDELVFTDGTTAGTYWLDVFEGSSSSSPTILGVVNSLLYFTATDADGLGIFWTNGESFTKLVSINSEASLLGWSDTQAFFKLSDTEHGAELWVADLTNDTFTLVEDIIPDSGAALAETNADNSEMLNGKLLFTAYASASDQGFFVSDGTADGTVQIGESTPLDRVSFGETIVIADTNGIRSVDISGISPSSLVLSGEVVKSNTDALQADSDQAYFLIESGLLLTSTGMDDPSVLESNVAKFKVVAENTIYFIKESNGETQLWYSDGTESGTRYIEDLPTSAQYFDLENAVAIRTVGISEPI